MGVVGRAERKVRHPPLVDEAVAQPLHRRLVAHRPLRQGHRIGAGLEHGVDDGLVGARGLQQQMELDGLPVLAPGQTDGALAAPQRNGGVRGQPRINRRVALHARQHRLGVGMKNKALQRPLRSIGGRRRDQPVVRRGARGAACRQVQVDPHQIVALDRRERVCAHAGGRRRLRCRRKDDALAVAAAVLPAMVLAAHAVTGVDPHGQARAAMAAAVVPGVHAPVVVAPQRQLDVVEFARKDVALHQIARAGDRKPRKIQSLAHAISPAGICPAGAGMAGDSSSR